MYQACLAFCFWPVALRQVLLLLNLTGGDWGGGGERGDIGMIKLNLKKVLPP